MKNQYPCKLIQDLMPLYYDGVCSRESAEAVKKHILECPDCRKYYEAMYDEIPGLTIINEAGNVEKERSIGKKRDLRKESSLIKENHILKEGMTKEEQWEQQKVTSFLAVRKRLRRKQTLVAISSMVLLCLMAGIIMIMLKNTERKIEYSANLTVSVTEKGFIGQLKGDAWSRGHTKRVDVERDGQQLTYLFFCLSGNIWDAVFINKDSYMEYTVCPVEKGAGDVDYVYYYTGDYSEIEMMGYGQLQEIVGESVLLWSSEGNE